MGSFCSSQAPFVNRRREPEVGVDGVGVSVGVGSEVSSNVGGNGITDKGVEADPCGVGDGGGGAVGGNTFDGGAGGAVVGADTTRCALCSSHQLTMLPRRSSSAATHPPAAASAMTKSQTKNFPKPPLPRESRRCRKVGWPLLREGGDGLLFIRSSLQR